MVVSCDLSRVASSWPCKLRGQEEAARDERVSYLHVAPLETLQTL